MTDVLFGMTDVGTRLAVSVEKGVILLCSKSPPPRVVVAVTTGFWFVTELNPLNFK